jgi:hypothetical protein
VVTIFRLSGASSQKAQYSKTPSLRSPEFEDEDDDEDENEAECEDVWIIN